MKPKQVVNETPEQKAYRETVEKIASNIATLADAVASLLNGPLKKKALVILLASSSRQTQATVEAVLSALQTLRGDWLNK
jgi:spore germination protein GerM